MGHATICLAVALLLTAACCGACGGSARDGEAAPKRDPRKNMRTPETETAESSSKGRDSESFRDVGGVEEKPGTGLEPSDSFDRSAFSGLGGTLVIDGSSTVFPITEIVAGLYEQLATSSSVRLGVSGTGGGFKKFCRGQTDISDASRPIKASEARLCAQNGVRFVEVPVAFDGISVVVHGSNDWATCMTVDELHSLWRPEAAAQMMRWNQVRPSWPDLPITLYAPGHDSGTFDYFTSAIIGEEGSARDDFIGSEDDYLLAQDIAHDAGGLGFFGFAYYTEYRDSLNLVAIDAGDGCVLPGEETIAEGRYLPLSRPIFIYLSETSLARPEVLHFVELYLDVAPRAVLLAGYVPLPLRAYELDRLRVTRRQTGSLFHGGSQVGVSIETLLDMTREAQR